MFAVAEVITNGSSAGRVIEVVSSSAAHRGGVRIVNIGIEQFGGNVGLTQLLPAHLLGSWRPVPFEWSPVVGGQLEERYVWTAGHKRLQRELRRLDTSQSSL